MARTGDFLAKAGQLFLKNDHYALGYIALFAILPFIVWLSVAIIALITLRKGEKEGFKAFLIGFIAFLFVSQFSMGFTKAAIIGLLTFLPCYLAALVLRTTTSMQYTGLFIVLQALAVICLVHWVAPDFIMNQFKAFQLMLTNAGEENNAFTELLTKQDEANQFLLANYLVGVQSVSFVCSLLASLLLARSIQSKLFYPLGFKQEIISFQANSSLALPFTLVVIGAYYKNVLAISCLPVLVLYYLCAGLSLSYSLLGKSKKAIILGLLALVFIPFIMIPAYTSLSLLDSLFNFRKYLEKVD
ncbi:MAG: hypothetical protein LCH30_07645 [Proteobacteria bacterium]|nr:hypothetical protein [Pseudomonadota bacterium]